MQSFYEYYEEDCPWHYFDNSYKTLLGSCLIIFGKIIIYYLWISVFFNLIKYLNIAEVNSLFRQPIWPMWWVVRPTKSPEPMFWKALTLTVDCLGAVFVIDDCEWC